MWHGGGLPCDVAWWGPVLERAGGLAWSDVGRWVGSQAAQACMSHVAQACMSQAAQACMSQAAQACRVRHTEHESTKVGVGVGVGVGSAAGQG